MIKKYEILKDGEVVNTIAASQEFVGEFYPNQYREVAEPEAPEPEPDPDPDPDPQPAILTVLQLRRLFTLQEKVAFEDAIQAGNSAVKVFMDDLAAADFVDLSDPLVIEGIHFLVQHEFLTQARADQILANEMPDAPVTNSD